MPNIEFMRNEIMKLGKSRQWTRKVKKMPDGQVLAIYKHSVENAKPKPKKPPQDNLPF